MKKRIGFIGLGIMGFHMAKHLHESDFDLIVFNRTKDKSEKFREMGVTVAESPAEIASKSNIVLMMLSNDDAIDEVCFGYNGIVKNPSEGLILINCGTSYPEYNISLYKKLRNYRIDLLDVPVTGSGVHAKAGSLTFMCGGNRDVFDEYLPLFKAMGKEAFYMGKIGSGSYTKLANNTMLAVNMLAFAEAVTLAAKTGVDPELFVKVASGGGGSNGMATAKVSKIVNRDFTPAFKIQSLVKDLSLISRCSEEKSITMPVTSLVRELINIANNQGLTNEDVCSIVKCYEKWSNTSVGKKNSDN